MTNKEINDYLIKHEIIKTEKRVNILQLLQRFTKPVSVDDIYKKATKMNIDICMSTIYRILDVFCNKKLVKKIYIPEENKTKFEFDRMIHKHYLICLSCKKIISIEGCPLKNYEHEIEEKTEFKVSSHRLEILGYCGQCKKKNDKKKLP